MTSEPGYQAIAIHILNNISGSKDNQAIKTDQLLRYNLRNIFREKSFTKRGGETIPRPFYKNSELSISLDQYSKILYILYFVLIVCQVEDHRK